LVPVKGVVTVDGKPLAKATVRFLPVAGNSRLAFGVTDGEGSFELTTEEPGDGIWPGEYKVVIHEENPQAVAFTPPADPAKEWGEWTKAMKTKKSGAPKAKIVPAIYGDKDSTPLKWKVPADGQVAVFELHK
jgi:hypothetical protein